MGVAAAAVPKFFAWDYDQNHAQYDVLKNLESLPCSSYSTQHKSCR
jgi:hypothetical protein